MSKTISVADVASFLEEKEFLASAEAIRPPQVIEVAEAETPPEVTGPMPGLFQTGIWQRIGVGEHWLTE